MASHITPTLLAIIGSASANSSNLKLVEHFAELGKEHFNVEIFDRLKELPHFSPELSIKDTPEIILEFRDEIQKADGILICTPEYVFSIPSGLKNAIEWCVSTTVFSGKPTGIITASADGKKGHEELKLIMRTVEAKFTEETTLLISGIKGKMNGQGQLSDKKAARELKQFAEEYEKMIVRL